MLTKEEDNYLQKIPKDKKVKIRPYDQKIEEIADTIINPIKTLFPDLDILHMGASGLGISGQGDLDIYAFARPEDFDQYSNGIKQSLGEPKNSKGDSIAWELSKGGYEVEFYLTDPNSEAMKRQIAVFNKLRQESKLLEEYRVLKESFNGKGFRDYQKAKYEFYHKILD